MAKRKPGPNSGIGTDLPPLRQSLTPSETPAPTILAATLAAAENTPQTAKGNIPPVATAADPAAVRDLAKRLSTRLLAEGRWMGPGGVSAIRDQMMLDAKRSGMDKPAAQAWVYTELDRLYPPLSQEQPATETPTPPRVAPTSSQVQGLGDIPWSDLPANASLAAEIQWVQSNRLYIVEELASGAIKVHLDRAHEPPPSRAALGWLETSIRSYAKYVDIAARATQGQQDEAEHVRRERLAIEEMRQLLQEMKPTCPHCGKSLM